MTPKIEKLLTLVAEFPVRKRINYDVDADRIFCNEVLVALKDAAPDIRSGGLVLPDPNSDWFSTSTGKQFHFFNPSPDEICIEDIACGLGNNPRFVGQTLDFYSVAQHSVLVSQIVEKNDPSLALAALLHDSPEAYICDLPSPLKRSLPAYKAVENLIWQVAIAPKFGLPLVLPKEIKQADIIALATERRDVRMKLAGATKPSEDVTPWPEKIIPLSSKDAMRVFLTRYYDLTNRSLARVSGDAPSSGPLPAPSAEPSIHTPAESQSTADTGASSDRKEDTAGKLEASGATLTGARKAGTSRGRKAAARLTGLNPFSPPGEPLATAETAQP